MPAGGRRSQLRRNHCGHDDIRGRIVSADPEESYQALLEHRESQAEITVEAMELGACRVRKKISRAKRPFADAVIALVDANRRYWPLNDRRLHYLLLNDPPLRHSSKSAYASLDPRAAMARRFKASGKERLILLVVSDADPEGMDIAESFGRSMRDDFGIEAIEVASHRPADRARRLREVRADAGWSAGRGRPAAGRPRRSGGRRRASRSCRSGGWSSGPSPGSPSTAG